MHIINVRLHDHIQLGLEVLPDNFLERGRRLSDSICADLQVHDSMFLKVTFKNSSKTYSQFIPWAQVASVFFDDTPAEKSPA